ncbi:MAG: hypothetical protein GEU93_05965 [Propionibacteriales bacterium]|nr:hypothetical protein [Propionibacteriales bacterium]
MTVVPLPLLREFHGDSWRRGRGVPCGAGGDRGGDAGPGGGRGGAQGEWPVWLAVIVVVLFAAMLTLLGMATQIMASLAGSQLPGA